MDDNHYIENFTGERTSLAINHVIEIADVFCEQAG